MAQKLAIPFRKNTVLPIDSLPVMIELFKLIAARAKIKMFLFCMLSSFSALFELIPIAILGVIVSGKVDSELYEWFIGLGSHIFFAFGFIFLVSLIFARLVITVLAKITIIFNNLLFDGYIISLSHNNQDNRSVLVNDAHRVIQQVILPMGVLLGRLVIASLLTLQLILIDPRLATICILVLTLFYLIVYQFLASKLKHYAHIVQTSLAARLGLVNSAHSQRKEILILGMERYFGDKNSVISDKIAKAYEFHKLSQLLPKISFENLILFVVLIFYFGSFSFSNSNSDTFLMFAVIGFKLLPIFQLMYATIVGIKASQSQIVEVNKLLSLACNGGEKRKKLSIFSDGVIKFDRVSLRYGPKVIFDNFSFNLSHRTGLVCVWGPSGVGKSTFLDLLIGRVEPDSGSIYFGEEFKGKYHHNIFSYCGQSTKIEGNSVVSEITYGRHYSDVREVPTADALLSRVILEKGGDTLSGGEAQRVNFVRALSVDRSIYIFDEPTSALDSKNAELVIRTLKEISLDKLIIVVSHDDRIKQSSDLVIELGHANNLD